MENSDSASGFLSGDLALRPREAAAQPHEIVSQDAVESNKPLSKEEEALRDEEEEARDLLSELPALFSDLDLNPLKRKRTMSVYTKNTEGEVRRKVVDHIMEHNKLSFEVLDCMNDILALEKGFKKVNCHRCGESLPRPDMADRIREWYAATSSTPSEKLHIVAGISCPACKSHDQLKEVVTCVGCGGEPLEGFDLSRQPEERFVHCCPKAMVFGHWSLLVHFDNAAVRDRETIDPSDNWAPEGDPYNVVLTQVLTLLPSFLQPELISEYDATFSERSPLLSSFRLSLIMDALSPLLRSVVVYNDMNSLTARLQPVIPGSNIHSSTTSLEHINHALNLVEALAEHPQLFVLLKERRLPKEESPGLFRLSRRDRRIHGDHQKKKNKVLGRQDIGGDFYELSIPTIQNSLGSFCLCAQELLSTMEFDRDQASISLAEKAIRVFEKLRCNEQEFRELGVSAESIRVPQTATALLHQYVESTKNKDDESDEEDDEDDPPIAKRRKTSLFEAPLAIRTRCAE